jgi:hypothetical protein
LSVRERDVAEDPKLSWVSAQSLVTEESHRPEDAFSSGDRAAVQIQLALYASGDRVVAG